MPRKPLNRQKDYIQIVIESEDKRAFEEWCLTNSTTMSEVIRRQIAPFIAKGKKLLEEQDK